MSVTPASSGRGRSPWQGAGWCHGACRSIRPPLPRNLFHPLLASLVYWLLDRLLTGQGHLLRILVVSLGGSFLYLTIALLTRMLRGSDFERARGALQPRAEVPHVALALRLIGLFERFSR